MDFNSISEGQRETAADLLEDARSNEMPLDKALPLLIAFERERGREVEGPGAELAVARMIRNDFGAEDFVEAAQLAASDLAMQRNAVKAFEAGERLKATGVMPGADEGFQDAYLKYVIPDIAQDEDAHVDWEAMSQGRFHDVSPMSSNIPFEEIKGYDYLAPEDRSWIHDNAVEPEPELVRSMGRRLAEMDSDSFGRDDWASIER